MRSVIIVRNLQPNEVYGDIVKAQRLGFSVIRFPIVIHPNIPSDMIVINYPGIGGEIDGYNDKYRKMAEHVQKKVGAVIRSGNRYYEGLNYESSVQNDLEAIIKFAIGNAEEICGRKHPDIYLMGFSAGASAIAAVAYKFLQVKKILLISPSGDAGEEAVTKGLGEFTGEVYIVGGQKDEIVGPKAAPLFSSLAKSASLNKLVIIPNCDHQFRGRVNGMIMSKAPIWAFSGDKTFPSYRGGIVLY